MGQILLKGIVKSYGKEVVVKNLDLSVGGLEEVDYLRRRPPGAVI